MAQTQSRRLAAKAFVDGKPYRGGAAVWSDGQRIYSYGYHYLIASRETGADGKFRYLVNEAFASMTTSQHRGAVRDALKESGWTPTNEIQEGENGHIYRVWR